MYLLQKLSTLPEVLAEFQDFQVDWKLAVPSQG